MELLSALAVHCFESDVLDEVDKSSSPIVMNTSCLRNKRSTRIVTLLYQENNCIGNYCVDVSVV